MRVSLSYMLLQNEKLYAKLEVFQLVLVYPRRPRLGVLFDYLEGCKLNEKRVLKTTRSDLH